MSETGFYLADHFSRHCHKRAGTSRHSSCLATTNIFKPTGNPETLIDHCSEFASISEHDSMSYFTIFHYSQSILLNVGEWLFADSTVHPFLQSADSCNKHEPSEVLHLIRSKYYLPFIFFKISLTHLI